MQVEDKIMYHFHKTDVYSEKWHVGSVIDNTKNYRSFYWDCLLNFSTAVMTKNGKMSAFDSIIKYYLEEENLSKEMMIRLLTDAQKIIRNANVYKRELALEECRRLYFPNLISRTSAIWLSEEKQLEFWQQQLNSPSTAHTELFLVNVSGELFKSSDAFIPNNELSFIESIEQSKKYWNPNFETEETLEKVEYLFQGKLKVLEKIR